MSIPITNEFIQDVFRRFPELGTFGKVKEENIAKISHGYYPNGYIIEKEEGDKYTMLSKRLDIGTNSYQVLCINCHDYGSNDNIYNLAIGSISSVIECKDGEIKKLTNILEAPRRSAPNPTIMLFFEDNKFNRKICYFIPGSNISYTGYIDVDIIPHDPTTFMLESKTLNKLLKGEVTKVISTCTGMPNDRVTVHITYYQYGGILNGKETITFSRCNNYEGLKMLIEMDLYDNMCDVDISIGKFGVINRKIKKDDEPCKAISLIRYWIDNKVVDNYLNDVNTLMLDYVKLAELSNIIVDYL